LVEFTIGVLNGTQLVQDEDDMIICSNSLVIDLIEKAKVVGNETSGGSIFLGLYAIYDMIYALHPLVFHCRATVFGAYNGSKWLFDEIDDIRRVIDNLVHNFSYMMDAILDVNSFFNESTRGAHLTGPYEAGYGIGMVVYYLIGDDTSGEMVDPAADAVLPLKFDWGTNIARWREEDRIKEEERQAAIDAAELSNAERIAAEGGDAKF